MNTMILFLIMIGVYVAITTFAQSIWRRKWIRELKGMAITEKNRNRFGELRTELMSLARNEELNIHGDSFKMLYHAFSIFMRNPKSYKAVTQYLTDLSQTVQSDEKGLGFFTKGEAALFMKYAGALDLLFKDYSRPYRWLSRYYEYKRRHQGYTIPLWLKFRLLRKEEVREAQEMRQTQERLVRVAEHELACV